MKRCSPPLTCRFSILEVEDMVALGRASDLLMVARRFNAGKQPLVTVSNVALATFESDRNDEQKAPLPNGSIG